MRSDHQIRLNTVMSPVTVAKIMVPMSGTMIAQDSQSAWLTTARIRNSTETPTMRGARTSSILWPALATTAAMIDRTPADLGTVDPQHVPGIRRQAKRYPRRNILDVEHPTKLCPRELGGRKIRTNTRRIDHELRNIRRHPATAPPHTGEIGSRHIRT